jgi:hypothetical protein
MKLTVVLSLDGFSNQLSTTKTAYETAYKIDG